MKFNKAVQFQIVKAKNKDTKTYTFEEIALTCGQQDENPVGIVLPETSGVNIKDLMNTIKTKNLISEIWEMRFFVYLLGGCIFM